MAIRPKTQLVLAGLSLAALVAPVAAAPTLGKAKLAPKPGSISLKLALEKFQSAARNNDLEQLRRMLVQNPGLVKARTADGQTALHAAVLGAEPEAARFLLQHGTEVDSTDSRGLTPLQHAIAIGDKQSLSLVETLVEFGADVNRPSWMGEVPLHLAVTAGSAPIATFLLAHGARDTTTPLFDALAQGDLEQLRAAIRKQPKLVNKSMALPSAPGSYMEREERLTPLHAAVLWNRAPLVQALLEAKANTSFYNFKGQTALHEAAALDEPEIVAPLLDAGADPNVRKQSSRYWFDGRLRETGQTPLHLATTAGSMVVAQLLLEHGAQVDLPTLWKGFEFQQPRKDGPKPRLGKTPLQYAVAAKNAPLVELFLSHGANAKGPNGDDAPLLRALSDAKNIASAESQPIVGIVGALLKAGANPNARDTSSFNSFGSTDTALTKAVLTRNSELVTLLLDAGADANGANSQGTSPFTLSLTYQSSLDAGYNTISKLLLARGANINGRDKMGRTPLFLAVARANFDMTRELLEHKADVQVTDKNGATPLGLSFKSGYDKITALLRSHGAHDATVTFYDALSSGDEPEVTQLLKNSPALLKTTNSKGETPLTHAINYRQNGMVSFLLTHGANVEDRSYGEPPLFAAVNAENSAVVRQLLKRGADINENSAEGYPVLFRAVSNDKPTPAFIDQLLQAGANAKAKDKFQRTALHVCVEVETEANPAIMGALIQAGADVNAPDREGITPLHLAAQTGKRDHILWLLAHGAKINARDTHGWTPLQWAEKSGETEAALLLKQKGGS
jgi:ankyrin repeat protein